ncbi:RNA 2',3'-cyclic phosphodiesterase [Candidatus Peregrinibacteria bacterium CG11_big_fil_rev_8_21_14_0_20_46_8]|nr:MAG: RNA 2',3'-cyclic phosphodiesterase [Candidatus Peregrinibacteria bacterium CG11_big_fil_rev_8_21_14_0_20_46_8]
MLLFIAIDLPPEVKAYLATLQARLPDEALAKPKNFHLTLMFLGECDEAMRQKVEAALSKVSFKPFIMSLSRVGNFGGRYYTRVLWAGIEAEKELYHLQQQVEERLSALGIVVDRRGYQPHITLARAKSPGAGTALNNHGITGIEKHIIQVNAFHLFQSHLDEEGSRHEILRSFPASSATVS